MFEMEENLNCIYMFTNKVNNKKYIGQTIDFNRRLQQHLRESKKDSCKYPLHKAIKKYGIENFDIKILHSNLTKEEMDEKEIFYIQEYKTLDRNYGYNISSGGSYGNPYAGKTKEEMKEIANKKSESRKGIIFTEEHKSNISKNSYMKGITKEEHPFYGKHHSEESKEKNRQAHLGKIHTEESKQKIKKSCEEKFGRKIAQYDKQGNLIQIWKSVKEASKQLGIDQSGIRKCVSGERKSSGGFIWKDLEGEDSNE